MSGFYATIGLLLVLAAMAGILRLPRRRRESRAERYFRNAVAVWRKEGWLRKIRALVRPVRSESQRQAGDEAFRKMVSGVKVDGELVPGVQNVSIDFGMVDGCDRTIEKGEAVQMDPVIGKIKPIPIPPPAVKKWADYFDRMIAKSLGIPQSVFTSAVKAKPGVPTLYEQLAKPVDETDAKCDLSPLPTSTQARARAKAQAISAVVAELPASTQARAKAVQFYYDELRRQMPTLCAAQAYQFAAMVVLGRFPVRSLRNYVRALNRQLPERIRAAALTASVMTEARTRGIPMPGATRAILVLCDCQPGTHTTEAMFKKVQQ